MAYELRTCPNGETVGVPDYFQSADVLERCRQHGWDTPPSNPSRVVVINGQPTDDGFAGSPSGPNGLSDPVYVDTLTGEDSRKTVAPNKPATGQPAEEGECFGCRLKAWLSAHRGSLILLVLLAVAAWVTRKK